MNRPGFQKRNCVVQGADIVRALNGLKKNGDIPKRGVLSKWRRGDIQKLASGANREELFSRLEVARLKLSEFVFSKFLREAGRDATDIEEVIQNAERLSISFVSNE